jgi:hypothetical protein
MILIIVFEFAVLRVVQNLCQDSIVIGTEKNVKNDGSFGIRGVDGLAEGIASRLVCWFGFARYLSARSHFNGDHPEWNFRVE